MAPSEPAMGSGDENEQHTHVAAAAGSSDPAATAGHPSLLVGATFLDGTNWQSSAPTDRSPQAKRARATQRRDGLDCDQQPPVGGHDLVVEGVPRGSETQAMESRSATTDYNPYSQSAGGGISWHALVAARPAPVIRFDDAAGQHRMVINDLQPGNRQAEPVQPAETIQVRQENVALDMSRSSRSSNGRAELSGRATHPPSG